MTEQVQAVGAQVVPDNVAPVVPAERMVPQSEMNKHMGEAKASAYEKGKSDALQELKANPSMSGMAGSTSPEHIQQMVQAGIQQHAHNIAGQQVLDTFKSRMLDPTNETLHPGFGKAFDAINFKDIPDIVHLATTVDNTASVMHDLINNPSKMVNLRNMNQMTPLLAQQEIKKLSDSIKMNQQALGQPTPQEPLGQVKPSFSLADNGDPKTASFKGKSWLKG